MHIGLCSDSFLPIVDGVGRVVVSYARAIAKRGEPCYVIAPMSDTGYRGGYPFELVDFISMGVPGSPQYSTGIPMLDSHYEQRISKIPLDIVHAHSPFIAGQEALRLAKKRNIPLVGTFHSRYYDDFYKATGTETLANMGVKYVVNFYDKCDEVWTVSYSSADTLHDYGYRGRIIVMPNGTPDVVPDPADRALAIKTFSLPDKPILFYCGQMNWKKNIRRILESAAEIQARGVDFALVFAGQGPDVDAIQSLAASLNLTHRVILTGHVTNEHLLNGLYQAASLFVFPSLYDTSGMVVREAAAMGTASVVVRGSAAAEPIHDGQNGLLCADTTESLADVLQGALSHPDITVRLGKSARETIYLSWDAIAGDVLERYRHLIYEKSTVG